MRKPVAVTSIFLVTVALLPTAMMAQKPTAAPSTAATTGSAGTVGTGTTRTNSPFGGNTSNSNTGNSGSGYDVQRPVFLSGSVIFDDGAPSNNEIRIERICNGSPHLEAHTDTKGRFSFQLGAQSGLGTEDADTSEEGYTPGNVRRSKTGLGPSPTSMGSSGFGAGRGFFGCELRASYPGYVSDSVDLSTRHSMDDSRVGVIVLHRLVNVKGTTISVISAQAPKAAQKNYEKAMQLVQKGKLDEAIAHFQSATAEYPKYALAWFDLGRLQQKINKLDDARASYLAAVAADTHYVSPYDALALLSAQQGKWIDTAKYSKDAIELNPVEFPSSLWYNALANYSLKNSSEAEKSARALTKLDSRHHYPDVETMLAEFAASKGDLDEAATHLKTYLALVPNAKNAAAVKHELEHLQQSQAAQAQPGKAQVAPQ